MKRYTWVPGLLGVLVGLAMLSVVSPSAASAALATPTVGLVSSVNPSAVGQRVVLKATVSDPTQPASSITGTMTFSDGGALIGTAAVTAAKASLVTRALDAGTHSLTASFVPTAGGAPTSSLPFEQTVDLANATVALVSSNPNAHYGDGGNVTATVKRASPASGTPTGTVDFSIDGGWYWTAPLDARGKATLPLSEIYPAFPPGTYSITATYSGDANDNPATTSSALTQTLIGISSEPVATISLDAKGQVSFSPSSFRLSSANPVGCNVIITNSTPSTQVLLYGTPGAWKRLPGGVIAAGGSAGVGVGLANFTGYFTVIGAANHVTIHCI